MNSSIAKSTIFGIGLILISLMLASQSHAKIDLEACVGSWLFDEGDGDVAADSSGKSEDSQINGAAWADGKFGKALSFDGATNFVEVPNIPDLNPKESMSMACWYI